MKKSSSKKKIYRFRNKSSKKINYIAILALVVIIVASLVFLKLGLNSRNNINASYSYSVQKSSPYEVVLLPNNFYLEKALPSKGYYASKSIDYFKTNLKYNFKGNKKTNLEYTYGITADLIGTVDTGDGEKKEVWTRNYVLQDNTVNSVDNTDEFSVDKNINIDYQNYNDLARSYEKNYGIAIEVNLKVRFNISYLIDLSMLNLTQEKTEDFTQEKADDLAQEKVEDYIELNIPVTSTITEVNEDYQSEISKDIYSNNNEVNVREIIFYVLSALSLLGVIAIIIMETIIKNKSTPEEIYNNNIKRILKYYRDLIVTVSNEPNLTGLETMNITALDDLIDVAEQNQSNIIHYEVVENERSNLYVIVGNYVYIYIVTSDTMK